MPFKAIVSILANKIRLDSGPESFRNSAGAELFVAELSIPPANPMIWSTRLAPNQPGFSFRSE